MAGRQRPSFLKRQKEEARRARAIRKREARQARRNAPDAPPAGVEPLGGETDPVDVGAEPVDGSREDGPVTV